MNWLWNRIQLYPARAAALFRATVVLMCAFGFQITAQQTAVLYLFAEGLLTFLTENASTPNPTAQAAVAVALAKSPP